jgi:hypothetical protein
MGRVAFLKKKGKNRWSWLNKHFTMFGENSDGEL